MDDPATDVVLLYLESFGNPRKFGRIARRVSRRKPVVAVKGARSLTGPPAWLAGSGVRTNDTAVDELFRQSGVIRVDTLTALFDTAVLLAHQPLPAGRRTAVVGNSAALALLAADACLASGLEVTLSLDVGAEGTAEEFRDALRATMARDDVDAVVTVFVPGLTQPEPELAGVLADVTLDVDQAGGLDVLRVPRASLLPAASRPTARPRPACVRWPARSSTPSGGPVR